jgi:hypothetical protein
MSGKVYCGHKTVNLWQASCVEEGNGFAGGKIMAKWNGWWEQLGLGRQKMHNLELEVDPMGTVTGEGEDCIGPFTLQGRFRLDGSVSLVKQYLGRHRVYYEGNNSGEGIFGTWHIPAFGLGRFALRPMADVSAELDQIEELVPARESSASLRTKAVDDSMRPAVRCWAQRERVVCGGDQGLSKSTS